MERALMGDMMTASQFQDELKRLARFEPVLAVENPLAAAVARIKANPALAQSRILGRFLIALAEGQGEFRRAEASALDSATLRLVVALMGLKHSGVRPPPEWLDAAAAANAARLDADR
jgi:hypothetical protein